MADRAKLLRAIFARGRSLGYEADDIRSLADSQGYGSSLKVLTAAQLGDLLSLLSSADSANGEYLEFRSKPSPEKYRLMAKISRLLWSQGKGWEYADGISQRMFECDRIDWLPATDLHSVAAALSKQAKREANAG